MRKQEEEIEEYSLVCPSFSTYSSHKLAHIADQITREHYSPPQNDTDLSPNYNHQDHLQNDDTDFEFIAFRKAAEGVFFDRFNGPVFPVFNQDLAGIPPECGGGANGDEDGEGDRNSGAEDIRFSMEELLIGEEAENRRSSRDPPSSSSSSEVDDDLDGIPPGTYCVWTPNPVQASPSRCKKSNSTGSSPSPAKRWKILDFFRRSKSDGKNTLVFLTPSASPSFFLSGFGSSKKEQKEKKEKKKKVKKKGANVKSKEECSGGSGGGGFTGKRSPAAVSAHEALYVRNREMRRVDKRRSYLPYRQDLVGFCATLNGMGRTFPPF
ncbi:uncharacterized protein LOC130983052 [Arachis stenosperma]|uniref:uncharacterized protein LOC130983052 n=1 Tax=Arachis stenosperma TaxID=217475 RepID=UPI0025AC8E57|nr:uncharacterized protein LOC130983052 [Arachis stenosperma]